MGLIHWLQSLKEAKAGFPMYLFLSVYLLSYFGGVENPMDGGAW